MRKALSSGLRGRTSCGARDAGDSIPGVGGGMCLSSARATGGVKAAVNRALRMRSASGPGTRLRSRRRAPPDPFPCARPAPADGDVSLLEGMALVDIVMRQILLLILPAPSTSPCRPARSQWPSRTIRCCWGAEGIGKTCSSHVPFEGDYNPTTYDIRTKSVAVYRRFTTGSPRASGSGYYLLILHDLGYNRPLGDLRRVGGWANTSFDPNISASAGADYQVAPAQ